MRSFCRQRCGVGGPLECTASTSLILVATVPGACLHRWPALQCNVVQAAARVHIHCQVQQPHYLVNSCATIVVRVAVGHPHVRVGLPCQADQ
eukprot:6818438-Lingulodinium_polyedra.AAC.1